MESLVKYLRDCLKDNKKKFKEVEDQDVININNDEDNNGKLLNNNTVTVRDRDTMEQVTISLDELVKYIEDKISF